jgi:broad specificity phosphatase PhoE
MESLSGKEIPAKPQPIEIYMIRHGETANNGNDVVCSKVDNPLSEKGKGQAREAHKIYKALLSEGKITNTTPIITTGKKRTNETAELFTNRSDFAISDGFMERGFGKWDGVLTNQLNDEFGSDFTPPGGENRAAHQKRIEPALKECIERAKSGPVIVVSHTGTMSRVANLLVGEKNLKIDNAQPYCARSLDNGKTWEFKKLGVNENNKIVESDPERKPDLKPVLETLLKSPIYKISLDIKSDGSSIFAVTPDKAKTTQQETKNIAAILGKGLVGNNHRTRAEPATKITFPMRDISIKLDPMQTEILQEFATQKQINTPPRQRQI